MKFLPQYSWWNHALNYWVSGRTGVFFFPQDCDNEQITESEDHS